MGRNIRTSTLIEKYGSVERAISILEKETEEFESLWGLYSSDCLGQGIACNKLMLLRLGEMVNNKEELLLNV